jgi:hypothetical protein
VNSELQPRELFAEPAKVIAGLSQVEDDESWFALHVFALADDLERRIDPFFRPQSHVAA